MRVARSWVSEILTDAGRAELTDAAELGVSELVTNALLHARPPLAVRVRGTRTHPRVEVLDDSPRLALGSSQALVPDDPLRTVGRGLDLIARSAMRWGWESSWPEPGKVVWFEPAPEIGEPAPLAVPATSPEERETPGRPSGLVIELLEVPVDLFVRMRRSHVELRREMQLLAFGGDSTAVHELAEQLTLAFAEGEAHLVSTRGFGALTRAAAEGARLVDMRLLTHDGVPDLVQRLLDLLHACEQLPESRALLTSLPSGEVRRMQEWFFGELLDQYAGKPPQPWTSLV